MKVKILTEFKHAREKYFPDEVVISDESTEITEAVAKFWCRAGWAEDVSGAFATGKPTTNDVVLLVEDINQATQTPAPM